MVLALDDKPTEEGGVYAVAAMEIPRVCRENPDWPGSLHGTCSNASAWSPSTNFPSWIDEEDYWKNKYPHTQKIRGCLTENLAERWASTRKDNRRDSVEEDEIPAPSIFWSEKDEHGDSVVFQIADALSEHEAYGIQVLASCVRGVSGEHYDHRSFLSGGGNDVTFLNFVLQKFLPGVASQLSLITHMVHNAIGKLNNPPRFSPNPSTLGIRTTEHLSYRKFPDGLGRHLDSGSVFTVLVFLSNPDDYEGGAFFVDFKNLRMETLSRPRRLSAMVFLSDVAFHGVKPILGGLRETFATEFWVYSDVPSTHRRPATVAWELYLERIKHDPDAPFPTEQETDALRDSGRSIWSGSAPNSHYDEVSNSATVNDANGTHGNELSEDMVARQGSADEPVLETGGDELC